jgi:hypothetical protein
MKNTVPNASELAPTFLKHELEDEECNYPGLKKLIIITKNFYFKSYSVLILNSSLLLLLLLLLHTTFFVQRRGEASPNMHQSKYPPSPVPEKILKLLNPVAHSMLCIFDPRALLCLKKKRRNFFFGVRLWSAISVPPAVHLPDPSS